MAAPKTSRLWVFCICLGLMGAFAGGRNAYSQTTPEWERTAGPFYMASMLWDSARFNEGSLKEFSKQLSRQRAAERAWAVSVFVDKDDLGRELYGKMIVETTYAWWRKLYEQFGRNILPMAEFYGYAGNIVLRLREPSGRCTETVLAGDNFLRVKAGATTFEILAVYFAPWPDTFKRSDVFVSVYARTPAAPTVPEAEEFTRILQRRYQQKDIRVRLRTDSYFITDSGFPIVYRFDALPSPPTESQYRSSFNMYCFTDPLLRCD